MAKFIPPKATEAEALSITPDEGELIYDETGRVLRMGDGVTPGGNKLQGLGNVASPSANGLMSKEDKAKLDVLVQAQIGSIALFAGAALPEGYLLCDGAALSRNVYAELFSAIGTAWGEGDGSTTFNLPDLTDKTAWGGDSEAVGNYKAAGLPGIAGELLQDGVDADTNNGLIWGGNGVFYVGGQQDNVAAVYTPSSTSRRPKRMGFDASRSSSVYGNSTTVQPPAAVMQFCIKYM